MRPETWDRHVYIAQQAVLQAYEKLDDLESITHYPGVTGENNVPPQHVNHLREGMRLLHLAHGMLGHARISPVERPHGDSTGSTPTPGLPPASLG